MSVTSESSESPIWQPAMAAEEPATLIFEYYFVNDDPKISGVLQLPKGTGWLSLWKESFPKLGRGEDIYINASGISNSSHRWLSYTEMFKNGLKVFNVCIMIRDMLEYMSRSNPISKRFQHYKDIYNIYIHHSASV